MVTRKGRYLLLLLICILVAAACFLYQKEQQGEFGWLIEPRYATACDFYAGVAWIKEKSGSYSWTLIDITGKVIISDFQAGNIFSFGENNLAVFYTKERLYKERLYGYVNTSGDIVISPEYQEAFPFNDGLASVMKDEHWGVIDLNGNIVLPFLYERVRVLDSNVIAVGKENQWRYVDRKGKEIFDTFTEYKAGWALLPPELYAMNVQKKLGLVNKKGEWILPASFDTIYPAPKGLIGVARDGKVGFVDPKGNVVIDFRFATVKSGMHFYRFHEDRAVVLLPESSSEDNVDKRRIGVINNQGELLFRLPGMPRGDYSEGFIVVQRAEDGLYGLVDREGKWHSLPPYLIPPGDMGEVKNGVLAVRVKRKNERYEEGKCGYLKIR